MRLKPMETQSLFNRITVNPEQCGGRPCIRNMRIRVSDVPINVIDCHAFFSNTIKRFANNFMNKKCFTNPIFGKRYI